ncbi:MAG: alpha-ketoacid dehydrogenase subunit beta [Actinobacteria bacterium]|nr:alpha-ketoacid dehydrogenase subunit beta [Actinomycetota bacterium]
MAEDANIILLGEDIGLFGGAMAVTKGLYTRFGPKRVIDTPISESAIIGAALGSALTGLRPIAEIMFIDFIGTCMDQVFNQVAKTRFMLGGNIKVPLVIRTQGGAGKSYAAQHSQSLEAWFIHVPGIKVVMPSTPYDAKGLLKSAIRDDNPVLFIEHKLLYNEKGLIPEEEYIAPLGKAEIKKSGNDITLVTYSRMVLNALEAVDLLKRDGIDVEVIDLRTLSPMDIETVINSVKKTNRLIIVEEDCKTGGVGAEISAQVTEKVFDYLDGPIERIAAIDTPIPFNRTLEKIVIPQTDIIVKKIKKIFKKPD